MLGPLFIEGTESERLTGRKTVRGVDSDGKSRRMSADISQSEPAGADGQLQPRVMWARRGYVLFAGAFVIGVLIQVYLAGMAVFMDPTYWDLHTTFVHILELIPAIMLVLAALGRFLWKMKLLPVGLFALIIVQYATAIGFSGSVVAALHPVIALVLFGLAAITTRKSWHALSELVNTAS